MNIYINGRFLTRPMTGVERYAYMICRTLAAQGTSFTIVCPHAPLQPCYDTENLPIVFYGRGSSHFWEQCVLPFYFIGKKDYLVFSFTGLGSVLIKHKVMTIHDLSFLENPAWFSRSYYLLYKLMTPLAVRTSRHIITVSEFSKNEILRFYPFVKAENVSVAYGAANEERFHRLPQEDIPPASRFVLAVSSLDPRKNFGRLVEAFEGLPDYTLCIVGSHNRVFTQEGSDRQASSNIRFLGRVSDEELLRLYNQASCFIFPSIYEGFGLPSIEAMHCGCPVLASNIPVMHEVCGQAAHYFDPNSVDSIRRAVLQYFQDYNANRAALQQQGDANIKRFSWNASAKAILHLAQRIANKA